MAPRAAPVEALMDELLGDILVRIPPDDPASLLRAALVCKRWGRIVSDPGFRRLFREFHRTPPLLGFFCNKGASSSVFVSTSSFRVPPAARVNTRAIDVRHGRVLLRSWEWDPSDQVRLGWEDAFHVWDPISGKQRELPVLLPGPVYPWSWNAAVLCAIDGCEHLDCHRGPFLVVFVGCGEGAGTSGTCAHVYSSEADSWSQQISAPDHLAIRGGVIYLQPSDLVENALYFGCTYGLVLKYDLAMRELSLIDLQVHEPNLLMATEDGGLGVAYILYSHKLYLLSRKAGPDDGAGWATKVINLMTLLPADDPPGSLRLLKPIGLDIILVSTSVGIFTIDLESIRVTKVCEESYWWDHSLPYISFCTPGTRVVDIGSSLGIGSRLLRGIKNRHLRFLIN